MIFLSYSE
jgi:serine/threonine protein kinase